MMNMCSNYMRDIFGKKFDKLQMVIPKGKIKFEVYDNETGEMKPCKDASFYSCYLTYKMNIKTEDLWLK